MALRIPIRFKVVSVVAAMLLAALGTFLYLATSLYTRDKLTYVFDQNAAHARAVAEETRATVTLLGEVGRVYARELDHATAGGDQEAAAPLFKEHPDVL